MALSMTATVWGADLPPAVEAALKTAGIPTRNVSVTVLSVDSGQAVIRHNAQQPMNPASTMKLDHVIRGAGNPGPGAYLED